MKKFFTAAFFLLSLLALGGCDENSAKSNTISETKLTEREKGILLVAADKSFVFDFKTDKNFKELEVWVEKYEFGKLVESQLPHLSAPINKKGSIVYAVTHAGDTDQSIHSIGVTGDGGTGSSEVTEMMEEGTLAALHSFWGSNSPVEASTDESVLAIICYATGEDGMSTLPSEFYNDPEGNLSELEEYDAVYLIKSKFIK